MRSVDGVSKRSHRGAVRHHGRKPVINGPKVRTKFYRLVIIALAVFSGTILGAGLIPLTPSGIAVAPLVSSLDSTSATKVQVVELGEPTKLTVPSLGISALVEHVGVTKKGAMEVPKKTENVAWYKPGPKPGQPGNAVIAGHYDNRWLQPAVFAELANLKAKDKIVVTDENKTKLTFTVDSVKTYKTENLPTGEIFKRDGTPRLVLITCGGSWSWLRGEYSERVVVFASIVDTQTILPAE